MVCSALVVDWRLATWPTSRSPLAVNATTDGVVLAPSVLAITFTSGWPEAPVPSTTDTHELVVPRSMPTIFPILAAQHTRPARRAQLCRGPTSNAGSQAPGTCLIRLGLGHDDQRRPDQLVT